ncbi:response regulator transcription factor [Sporolactobacillus terrae]|uniref:DNA-binding response regulator n=1 Tax=Sporolactobacillus terrae TaxID=269673 RepID=A0A410DAS5_9BACL|nr:response regulator transcription factor [Sporolactobacillus terrae]QAA23188.1 DNA-binding response regulator [Sporolactobacillus terrae]QAA26158.1 DNA-binding response regulator [Sporolactobacillus terrae]BBN99595.1 DNA-binding response regulator [Sporolactobacillus terrae]
MTKVFIVEDDAAIVKQLASALNDYTVVSVQNFRSVCQEIEAETPDLILMDITLPYFNGFYWTTEIRKHATTPILFLSSADDEMNQVMAMNMGADDYVTKPFSVDVLKAKINALLRRTYSFSQAQLTFNGFVLEGTEVKKGTNKAVLTPTEAKLLRTFFEQPNQTVTKDLLLAKLWESDEYIDANALHVNIARMRKKLHAIGFDYIGTVRGVGYVLA